MLNFSFKTKSKLVLIWADFLGKGKGKDLYYLFLFSFISICAILVFRRRPFFREAQDVWWNCVSFLIDLSGELELGRYTATTG